MMNEVKSDGKIVTKKFNDGPLKGISIQFDRSKLNEVEEVLVLWPHRAKPEYEKTARSFAQGEKYKVSGLPKAEVLMNGWATTDLKTQLPPCHKRKAPKPGEEKYLTPQGMRDINKLKDQVIALTALVEQLTKKK